MTNYVHTKLDLKIERASRPLANRQQYIQYNTGI